MTYDHIVNTLTQSRLTELLDRSGITIDELARLTGASPRTLEAIQAGNYDPPLSLAYKLAAAFYVPIEQLFADYVEKVPAD